MFISAKKVRAALDLSLDQFKAILAAEHDRTEDIWSVHCVGIQEQDEAETWFVYNVFRTGQSVVDQVFLVYEEDKDKNISLVVHHHGV